MIPALTLCGRLGIDAEHLHHAGLHIAGACQHRQFDDLARSWPATLRLPRSSEPFIAMSFTAMSRLILAEIAGTSPAMTC
jgi:hypothetical protein